MEAIFLGLTSQGRETIVELDINKLSCHQGVENLIEELGKLDLKGS